MNTTLRSFRAYLVDPIDVGDLIRWTRMLPNLLGDEFESHQEGIVIENFGSYQYEILMMPNAETISFVRNNFDRDSMITIISKASNA